MLELSACGGLTRTHSYMNAQDRFAQVVKQIKAVIAQF